MRFRIFKENSISDDERSVSTLNEAAALYREYFTAGYSVRVIEAETGVEYAMSNERLVRIPYPNARHHAGSR